MTTPPSSLFVAFIEQGIKKGFIHNVTKTLDGEHYLSDSFIQTSIIQKVEESGKTTVEEIANELCIEQPVITKALSNIIQDKRWTVIDDLIFTQNKVDDITQELEAELKNTGHLFIIAQTQQRKLPYSLLKSITQNMKEYISYPQIPDFLATNSYIEDCKSSIIESLKGLEEPYPTFKLQKSHNMQEDLFYLLLEHCMKENTSLGFLRGKRSRAIFEPKGYKDRQLTLLKSIFDSNEYISFNTIENLYSFVNPTDLIADNYNKDQYICLYSCFIKCSVKDKAKTTIESIQEYCDVNELLPSGLMFEDVHKVVDIILSELSNNHKKYIDLEGGYIAKSEYLEKLISDSNHYLRNLSRTVKQKQSKNHTVHITLSDNDIIKAFESIGCPYHIAEKVMPFTRNTMCTEFAELLQTPFIETDLMVTEDAWIMTNKACVLEKLKHTRQMIYFTFLAMQAFSDETSKKSLEKYILKHQCTEYLFHLVIYSILDQSYNKAEVAQSTSLCIPLENIEKQDITDIKQQKYVISYFVRENDHKYDNSSIVEIESLVKKKDLKSFITKFLLQDKQNLYKDTLDSPEVKAQANTMVYQQLHSQLQSLTVSKDTAPQLLHLVSLLIFQKLFQIPLYVSGKFVPAILGEIKRFLKEDEQELLYAVHMSVMGTTQPDEHALFIRLKQFGMNYE